MSAVRVDRWLCATRLFKSRTLAGQACAAGAVRINNASAKASQLVRPGDMVSARAPSGQRVLEVVGLADKRLSAPLAQALYIDHSPVPDPKTPEDGSVRRERGAGRPTKSERRAMDRFKGR